MLSICYICLSTDRTLQALKEPLSNWHDELCDFGIEGYALYCSECTLMLNKFHNFKRKCQQANKLLKKWKNQNPKVRTELSQLKKKMPPSPLSFTSSKNHAIYVYQEIEDPSENQNYSSYTLLTGSTWPSGHAGFLIDTSVPIHLPNSNIFMFNTDSSMSNIDASTSNVKLVNDISSEEHPEITNTNIETSRNMLLKTEPYNENELFKDFEVKIEGDGPNKTETIVSEELKVKKDIDSDYNDDSNHNITSDSDEESDIEKLFTKNVTDNSSDDEILLKKRKRSLKTDRNTKKAKKKVIDVKKEADSDIPLSRLKKKTELKKDEESHDKKVKKVRPTFKKINLELLKHNLLCKFASKEVKDEDGNIIDKDGIIDSLDKMHKLMLRKIERHCSGPKPFTPEAIQLLTRVQKRYGNQFSSVFTTVHLSTTEQVLEEFSKRQQHESYLTSEHKCTVCYRGFKYKQQLEYHINEYHNSERRAHGCQICQMRFKDAQGLRRHVRTHRVIYKCKLCPLVTNFSSVMETHYNQHNGVKHTCELCKAVLNSKTSLYAHMNSTHPSRDIFCQLCARTFNSEYGLTQHKLRKHAKDVMTEGPPSARCESCDVTFVSDTVYQTHVRKSHTEHSICTIRKRRMTGKRKLPNMVCRVCKKVEHSMGRLKLHFKTEHPLEPDTVSMCLQTVYNHLCHVCGKGFKNIGDLNEHKHLHTGAKPYACAVCPATFHRKINLRSHLERHAPPTRECQHCGKKFVSASNLNNHIKTHIGIRSYTCELCDKSFLHRGALDEHVRGVHLRIRRARKQNHEQNE